MDDPQFTVSIDTYGWDCSCGVEGFFPKMIGALEAANAVSKTSQAHLKSHDRTKAKERSFMKMAYATAELATCPRLSVGAVIVDPDGYIVASGRNGAPPGLPHCKHPIDEPCTESSHAELNAVIFAGRPLAKGGTMYVTHAPCKPCSGAILASGLKAVIYDQLYKNTDGIDRLVAAGIEVRKLG